MTFKLCPGFCLFAFLLASLGGLAVSERAIVAADPEARASKDVEVEPKLRLITYNVWYGFTRVPARKVDWLDWMKAQSPDIVSLQELNGYTKDQLKKDAAAWGHAYSVLLKEDGFPTGITSRFPITDVQRIREGFHHGLLRVQIRGIYVYVIHLHPSNWETRGQETTLLLKNIATLPQDSSVILAGDFNTFSSDDMPFYKDSTLEPFFQKRDEKYREKNLKDGALDYSVMDRFRKAGLIDLEHQQRKSNTTFTGSFPTKIEKPGDHGDQRRLDYVLTSSDLAKRVVRAEIIANDTTQTLSDHLPMIVDFRFDNPNE